MHVVLSHQTYVNLLRGDLKQTHVASNERLATNPVDLPHFASSGPISTHARTFA